MFQKRAFAISACFAVALTIFPGGAALAGPYVVPGIGPEDAADMRQPERVRPVAATSRGDLGGGFIEMLATGLDSAPAPRDAYAPPQAYSHPRAYAEPQAYAPPQAYGRRTRIASYDPGEARVAGEIDPAYARAEVDYATSERPGSIVVDTPNKYLYLVQRGGRAIRYGIGVGRPGFEWSGVKSISRKAQWPDWTPPDEMLARRPDLPRFMPGGPANPLGARALYLGSSLYRIHGTNEPHTIGQNVSSGCIRMMNEDVTDLYERVPVGARVVVR
jgi:lipoprotein-anchoring transpeptidase ErfK/SrfK